MWPLRSKTQCLIYWFFSVSQGDVPRRCPRSPVVAWSHIRKKPGEHLTDTETTVVTLPAPWVQWTMWLVGAGVVVYRVLGVRGAPGTLAADALAMAWLTLAMAWLTLALAWLTLALASLLTVLSLTADWPSLNDYWPQWLLASMIGFPVLLHFGKVRIPRFWGFSWFSVPINKSDMVNPCP